MKKAMNFVTKDTLSVRLETMLSEINEELNHRPLHSEMKTMSKVLNEKLENSRL